MLATIRVALYNSPLKTKSESLHLSDVVLYCTSTSMHKVEMHGRLQAEILICRSSVICSKRWATFVGREHVCCTACWCQDDLTPFLTYA